MKKCVLNLFMSLIMAISSVAVFPTITAEAAYKPSTVRYTIVNNYTQPYWCTEGGTHHILTKGLGWYYSYDEAYKAGGEYINKHHNGNGGWYVDQCDCGKWTVEVRPLDDKFVSKLTIPTITGFKVSSTTNNSAKLTWNKVANADGYIVYKYDNTKKTWIRIVKTKNTSNTYTVSKLNSGTTYKFAVKAYKTVGGKEITSVSYPQLSLTTNPSNVTGFKASSTSANAIKLTWNKSSGANGYVVYRYNTSTKKYGRIAKITSNAYTDKKLKAGTNYKYAVRSYKTVNGKELLSTSYPQLLTTTNPATVSFTLSPSTNKVTVKWNKVTGATGYKVYYKTSKNGKWIGLKTTNNKTTSYTKSGLTKGKTYYFTVKAYRTVGGKTYNGAYTAKSIKVK